MNQFARMLERWRDGRPWEVVAPLIGCADGTAHAYGHGKSLPPKTRLPAIAAGMGVSVDELAAVIAGARRTRQRRLAREARSVAGADQAEADAVHGEEASHASIAPQSEPGDAL
jgi:hydrogenase/urease accessory protein HupE